jgi:oligopeptide/dipeptide ABC transporter ATP-binding protein
VAAVMREPQHPYTQRLLASQPRNGRAGEKLPSIPGQPPAPGEIISGCRFRPRCHMACDRCETEAPELRDVPNGGVSACLRAVPAMAAVA